MNEIGDAFDRHIGEFGQRLLEQRDVAGQQRAQDETGGQLPARCADGGSADAFASTAYPPPALPSPFRRPRARCAGRDRRRATAARRQSRPGSRTPWRPASAASPARYRHAPAALREWRRDDRSARRSDRPRTARSRRRSFPASTRQASARADFGDGGRNRARQGGAACDRDLHRTVAGRDRVDQVGVDEKRRQRQHRRGDLRLIGGERQHDGGRRARARRQARRPARGAPAAKRRRAASASRLRRRRHRRATDRNRGRRGRARRLLRLACRPARCAPSRENGGRSFGSLTPREFEAERC